jgi:hypothetical protein
MPAHRRHRRGAVSEKIRKKPKGNSPNYGEYIAAGTSGPAVTLEISCHQTTTQSFAQNGITMKIFEGLSNSKKVVFNVKKLLNVWT